MKKTFLASLAILSLALLGCGKLPTPPAETPATKPNPVASFFSISVNSIANHSIVKTLPLTLSGNVSDTAQEVSINDVALLDYTAGSGEWSHQIDKMQEGENTYKILARDANNAKIATTLILTYQPE